MTMWLYQMATTTGFSPEIYRDEVWEDKIVRWGTHSIQGTKQRPEVGDTIVFWFAKTRNKEPGLYGWGVVVEARDRSARIGFRTVHPSDYMKMHPIYGEEVEKLIHHILGRMRRATMWKVSDKHARAIRSKIHQWAR